MANTEDLTSLTKKERLMLINQYLILEKLYPESADSYRRNRRALEDGYTLHYGWLYHYMGDDMSVEDCRYVLSVLELYEAISWSYRDLVEQKANLDGLTKDDIRFMGFDGNQEPEFLGYARYFVHDLNRFNALVEGDGYLVPNSHYPTTEMYRQQLARWKHMRRPRNMEASEIKEVLRG